MMALSNSLLVLLLFFFKINLSTSKSTLYIAPHLVSKRSEPSYLIDIDDLKSNQNAISVDSDQTDFEDGNLRIKRNIVNELDFHAMINVFHLNDSHEQMLVHWVGKDGNVVVCLTRDRVLKPRSQTTVYISRDNGRTFSVVDQLTVINDKPAIISKAFTSPIVKDRIIFTDVIHSCLFTTVDTGQTFRGHFVPFKPDVISFHPLNEDVILAMDTDDSLRRLWLSDDFGETWNEIQMGVKSFYWGVPGLDSPNTLFVQRQEANGHSTILRLSQIFKATVLLSDVMDFELHDKYLFATRWQRLLGGREPQLQLWVSYNRGEFRNAFFPLHHLPHKEYYIADASEDQVFACVMHNDQTNLYISEVQGLKFSLSLERILYLSPNATWWAPHGGPVVDLYKVAGLRGVYLANQARSPHRPVLTSLVTFDKGAIWQRLITHPVDMNGHPLNCSQSANCSLQITQKFTQLFPWLRSSPIFSKKSAMGIIIASGVMGPTIKGNPNVYVSSDAGMTWHEVLQSNYLYTMGDHGGIMVAVQYYTPGAATDTLLYSTDEGESWDRLQFLQDGSKVHVFGLMTEPGERTTVFTIFGSIPFQHRWVWIRVDLRSVFKMDCKPGDYKKWIPLGPNGRCLLGQMEVFERRRAHVPCYNGQDYERPISVQPCPCSRDDYECDYGYRENGTRECVKEEDMSPTIPASCAPGKLYNLTQGYRKVSGDQCKDGLDFQFDPKPTPCPIDEDPEFLIVTLLQKIGRLNLNSEQISWESIPVPSSINVIAFDFDTAANCIYFADIIEDKILRQCLDGHHKLEVLLQASNMGSVEGIALDWISNNLYFVDGQQRVIRFISTNHISGRPYTVLNHTHLGKPRGIALHPPLGYMFVTDWSATAPAVYRAHLDGTNLTTLFDNSTVAWPNGIAVDFADSRIFWADAKRDYIASSDFDGKDLRYVIQDSSLVPHPFAVAVYKDWVYFDDWIKKEILVANKYSGLGLRSLASTQGRAMDLKIFSRASHLGSNHCGSNVTGCSHFCVGTPSGHKCLCPDGAAVEVDGSGNQTCYCSHGRHMDAQGFCSPLDSGSCMNETEFMCHDGKCIPLSWNCDHHNDCQDNSDESSCYPTCNDGYFACQSGQCIPISWLCDFERDCIDGSDEQHCPNTTCPSGDFHCKNGRCIKKVYVCDFDDDCKDGSDEENCTTSVPVQPTCTSGYEPCPNAQAWQCILPHWRCDGDQDCPDGSDEIIGCKNASCGEGMFRCLSTNRCIPQRWACDGADDCTDGSDEVECPDISPTSTPAVPIETTTSMVSTPCPDSTNWFTCSDNVQCIALNWLCDGVADCLDKSDELDCARSNQNITSSTPAPSPTPITFSPAFCAINQYECENGECIWDSAVCDGFEDCPNGDDEQLCFNKPCQSTMFKCMKSFGCIKPHMVCDGKVDCADKSDEMNCGTSTTPNSHEANATSTASPCSEFLCGSGECYPILIVCNEIKECADGSDEYNCTERSLVVRNLNVDSKSITSHGFTLMWEPPHTTNDHLNYLLSYMPVIIMQGAAGDLWNYTTWVDGTNYTFEGLQPGSRYNCSVLIRFKDSMFPQKPYHPVLAVRTLDTVPLAPANVSAQQEYWKVGVYWNATSDIVTKYRVYVSPPILPYHMDVAGSETKTLISLPFKSHVTYTIWVSAFNGDQLESPPSARVSLVYQSNTITSLRLAPSPHNNYSFILSWLWNSSLPIKHYSIHYCIKDEDYTYDRDKWTIINTTQTSYELEGLGPGVLYSFRVWWMSALTTGIGNLETRIPGTKLPQVDFALENIAATSVLVNWTVPSNAPKNYNYRIVSIQSGSLVKLATLDKPPYQYSGLRTCTNYDLGVRLVGPHGELGPFKSRPVMTLFDPLKSEAPIPHSAQSLNSTHTRLVWSTPCLFYHKPLSYYVLVRDHALRRDHWLQLAPQSSMLITLDLLTLPGANYSARIKVAASPDPRVAWPPLSSAFYWMGPALPTPTNLQVLYTPGQPLNITWTEPSSFQDNKTYMVEMTEKEGEHMLVHPYHVDKPPFQLSAPPIGIRLSFTVRLMTSKGYQSRPTPAAEFTVPKEEASHQGAPVVALGSGALAGVVSGVLLVVVGLTAVLGLYVVRHRRLQASLLTLANSHYDPRSGAVATFRPSATELDEEDDSPMIRGFSDDEPLVVA